jgi:YD repeat-containing protein
MESGPACRFVAAVPLILAPRLAALASPSSSSSSFTYDPLNRLTSADYSTGETFAYQYDAVGNRTAMTETTALDETTVTTYTYDTANRLLASLSPGHLVSYAWDDRGNLTSDGTFTYTYSAAGRLVRAQSVSVTLVYTYTAEGLRVAPSGAGDVTTFAWDWASGIPEMLSDDENLYLVAHDTLGWWDGAVWAYYLSDALGSVRQEVDATGAVTGNRKWMPYGVEIGAAQAGLGYTGEW